MPEPKRFKVTIEEDDGGPGPSGTFVFLLLLAFLVFLAVILLWKTLVTLFLILSAIAALAGALYVTVKLVEGGHRRLAIFPLPSAVVLALVVLYAWGPAMGLYPRASLPGGSIIPTPTPTPRPTPIRIPPDFTSPGPVVVSNNLGGRGQQSIPLELEESHIVRFELEAIGEYKVPFQVSILGPSNDVLGSVTGSVINPVAFQAASAGRHTIIVKNTSGDFRGFKLTYTIWTGRK